jgi:hypothetical protein
MSLGILILIECALYLALNPDSTLFYIGLERFLGCPPPNQKRDILQRAWKALNVCGCVLESPKPTTLPFFLPYCGY